MDFSRISNSRFFKDALSLSGGTAVAQVIAIGALPVLTRIYTPEEFGVLAMYMAISSLLSVFASLKLEQAIMLPETDREAAAILVVLLISSLVFALILLVMVMLFGDNLLEWIGNPEFKTWLYLLPFSIFLLGSYQGLRFWQMRQRHFRLVSIGLVSAVVLSTAVSILIGVYYKTLLVGGAGLIIGYIIQGLANTCVLLKGMQDKDVFSGLDRKSIVQSVMPHKKLITTLLVSHGVAAVYSRLPTIAIGGLFGNTILGFYSMAERIISAPATLISNAIGDVFRQRASVDWREKGRCDYVFWKTLRFTAAIGIPLYLVGIIIAPDVFKLAFGEQWIIAGEYASILLMGGMASFIVTPIDKLAIIVGAYRYIFKWHLYMLITNITIVGMVTITGWPIKTLLILLVINRVLFYVVDLWYESEMAKGRHDD